MDLDDILEDALDEVTKDDEEDRNTAKSSGVDVKEALSSAAAVTAKTQEENAEAAAAAQPTGEDAELANLLKMFGNGSDFEKVLDDAFKDLDLNDLMSKLGVTGEPGNEEADMEKLMKMLAGETSAPGAAPDARLADPKFLEELAGKLESTMSGDQMDRMFENMLKSVMSKDVMYEPVKMITEEFPKVLSSQSISPEDRSRFESQFDAYKALRKLYEAEEQNMDQIMLVVKDLERFGQPPEEISKLLGSGANLGAGPDGLPPMPNPNQCPTQ